MFSTRDKYNGIVQQDTADSTSFNTSFFRGSTALIGLVLTVEFLNSHSVRHTTLGRTPLDE
jgi:hypothetical protein